jgi:hypothetical protein
LIKVASALFLIAGLLPIAGYWIWGFTDRSSLLLGGAFLVVAVGIFYSPKIEKALGISRDQSYKAPTEQYDKLGK